MIAIDGASYRWQGSDELPGIHLIADDAAIALCGRRSTLWWGISPAAPHCLDCFRRARTLTEPARITRRRAAAKFARRSTGRTRAHRLLEAVGIHPQAIEPRDGDLWIVLARLEQVEPARRALAVVGAVVSSEAQARRDGTPAGVLVAYFPDKL
ncbi:MAG: hypothetical protein U0556_09730 [Dehalococcoidia bacterium]